MIRFHERLTSMILTREELNFVQTIYNSQAIGWTGKLEGLPRGSAAKRDQIKQKIKDYLFTTQGQYCAYCCFNLEINFGAKGIRRAHIDHILPKGNQKYKKFVFEPENLVLACSRCNGFAYKGEKDYGLNTHTDYPNINVNIIHPYRDRFLDHLSLPRSGAILIIVNNSVKGQRTLDEFGLNELVMLCLRGAFVQVKDNSVENEDQIQEIVARNYSTT